jgi:hypothetical protein
MQTTTCKNCNDPIAKNFCSNCGTPCTLRRIDGQYIIHEIRDFFFANKGMIYTVKKVLISPGKAVREFISEDRFRFVKPITFLFITSLIFTFVNYLFNFGQEAYGMNLGLEEGTMAYRIYDWLAIKYPAYGSILTGLVVAFFVKLFFRKTDYNLLEIFILICFVSGVTALSFAIVAVIQGVTHWNILFVFAQITAVYFVWAIGQFYNQPQFSKRKKVWNYVKAFLAFIVGAHVFFIIIVIIGTIIDTIQK